MMRLVVLSVLVFPLLAVKIGSEDALDLGLDEAIGDRPIMKIVKLLQDMKKQLDGEVEADKDLHEKMDCWCETNNKKLTKAIDEGETSIKRLKAFLGESAGKISEMKVRRKETKEELAADQQALKEADSMRTKENKAFAKDETDTIEALAAAKNAVKVLSKHNTGLVEVKAVASVLRKTNILRLGFLNNLKRAALQDFFKDTQGATSFLSIPSYGSQSGQIFGILNQMVEDFEDHLSTIRAEETKAGKDFTELKAAKEEEITEGKKQLTELDENLGTVGEKAAQAEKDLKQTKEQLGDDQTSLVNLKKKCKELDEEYDQRSQDRLAELDGVQSAISTLNDEDSFKVFDKTLSFLQTRSTESASMKMTRQVAARALEHAAARVDSPVLALLASRVRLDSFKKVKEAISNMIAELLKEQKDESDHKDWCDKSFDGNTKDTKAGNDKKDSLTTKKDNLKKNVDTLVKKIDSAKTVVAETKEQMKKASETREAANADYQQTISDQRMTQMILRKAIDTLKQVYALVQSRRSQSMVRHSSTRHEAAPEFKKYEKNAGGAGVVKMLEDILKESKKSEADAIKAEQSASTAYETFMTDSNKALVAQGEQISTLSGNKAKAKEDFIATKKDLASTNANLANLAEELDDLHGSCDFIINNFKVRQAARSAETDALKEAMSALSGAK